MAALLDALLDKGTASGDDVPDLLSLSASHGQAPVVDVTQHGFFKVGGKGLVATDTIAAGETVLHEVHPLCRAQLSAPLLELQEETAMLVQMGYVEFWPHAVKDKRIVNACRTALEAAPAEQRAAFLELDDSFAAGDEAAGRFLTNDVQLRKALARCSGPALFLSRLLKVRLLYRPCAHEMTMK